MSLLTGVVIGRQLRSPKPGKVRDLQHTSAIATRLKSIASGMSSSVGKHSGELQRATELLTEGEDRGEEALADLVANVIGNVVQSNQSLQAKLDTAEGRLHEQAVEIEAHISRSLTDPLTGLPNRREFNERLEERMSAWNRRQEVFTLLLVDVDHFKRLNDQHGHLAGDRVLSLLAGCLRSAIRREDAIARYGGEEFAILLPNTSLEQAAVVAKNVGDAAERLVVQHNNYQLAITISGGLASIQPGEQVESLIQRADAVLYAAKAAGRNRSFSHDGVHCTGPDGHVVVTSAVGVARLGERIQAVAEDQSAVGDCDFAPEFGFGDYLPREKISASLAEKCNDLRQALSADGR